MMGTSDEYELGGLQQKGLIGWEHDFNGGGQDLVVAARLGLHHREIDMEYEIQEWLGENREKRLL